MKMNHFKKAFLLTLPPNLMGMNERFQKNPANAPNLDQMVGVRVKQAIGHVMVDDTMDIDLQIGDTYVLPYNRIKPVITSVEFI
jgi:hypothetical protein